MIMGSTRPADESRDERLRVLIADDHTMILDMFAIYLEETSNMSVRKATSLSEALDLVEGEGPFDIVLLDLNMPGMSGVTGLKRAIKANDKGPVAIITGNPTPRMIEECIGAGAAGIVLKTTPVRSLATALRFMADGEIYLPRELMRETAQPGRRPQNGQLSDREMSVMRGLAEGLQNKEIAAQLALAEPTVKMHVTAICRKLGAQNRTQAVIMARDLGIV